MTDSDLAAARLARTPSGWLRLLDQTEYTRARVGRHRYRQTGRVRMVSARSSRLNRAAGPGWVAVGDAAASHDPLSSQGIVTALEMGQWAGLALVRHLAGDRPSLAEYAAQVQDEYGRYLQRRSAYYAVEQRWPCSPFWQRRHAAPKEGAR
jgi:flavin-dependent dehydrogenase